MPLLSFTPCWSYTLFLSYSFSSASSAHIILSCPSFYIFFLCYKLTHPLSVSSVCLFKLSAFVFRESSELQAFFFLFFFNALDSLPEDVLHIETRSFSTTSTASFSTLVFHQHFLFFYACTVLLLFLLITASFFISLLHHHLLCFVRVLCLSSSSSFSYVITFHILIYTTLSSFIFSILIPPMSLCHIVTCFFSILSSFHFFCLCTPHSIFFFFALSHFFIPLFASFISSPHFSPYCTSIPIPSSFLFPLCIFYRFTPLMHHFLSPVALLLLHSKFIHHAYVRSSYLNMLRILLPLVLVVLSRHPSYISLVPSTFNIYYLPFTAPLFSLLFAFLLYALNIFLCPSSTCSFTFVTRMHSPLQFIPAPLL